MDGKEVDEAIARSSKASAVPSSLSVKKRGKVTYEEAEKEAQQLPDSAAAVRQRLCWFPLRFFM